MLTRDSILEAQDLKTVDVDVPEWGGTVRLRAMMAADRHGAYAVAVADGKFDNAAFLAYIVERTAVNEDGGRLFQDGDAKVLVMKSSGAMQRLEEAATKLNALAKSAVDDAEKNSEPLPSGASS
jgi:hypothetical protein